MSVGRGALETIGEKLADARRIRFIPEAEFGEDLTKKELETAAAYLWALGYSCQEGARKLEHLAAMRCTECEIRPKSDLLDELCPRCSEALEVSLREATEGTGA